MNTEPMLPTFEWWQDDINPVSVLQIHWPLKTHDQSKAWVSWVRFGRN